jgi:hypothetical protein
MDFLPDITFICQLIYYYNEKNVISLSNRPVCGYYHEL